jgi:hypothetical protein
LEQLEDRDSNSGEKYSVVRMRTVRDVAGVVDVEFVDDAAGVAAGVVAAAGVGSVAGVVVVVDVVAADRRLTMFVKVTTSQWRHGQAAAVAAIAEEEEDQVAAVTTQNARSVLQDPELQV